MLQCQPVDLDFIEHAPLKFINSAELDLSADEVFAILADVDSWPVWFGGMTNVTWLTPAPYGVGSQRQVTLSGLIKVSETFLVWVPGKRFCFRFEQQNALLAKAAIEDIQLEVLANKRCKITYSVYMALPTPISFMGFALKPILNSTFKRGVKGLQKYCETLTN
jgi:hypothetical protein